jgi:hypothetical protein
MFERMTIYSTKRLQQHMSSARISHDSGRMSARATQPSRRARRTRAAISLTLPMAFNSQRALDPAEKIRKFSHEGS